MRVSSQRGRPARSCLWRQRRCLARQPYFAAYGRATAVGVPRRRRYCLLVSARTDNPWCALPWPVPTCGHLARSCRRPLRSIGLADEQLESVVPGAACAADLDPGDADRFELARAVDAADVDRIGPAEVGQHVADGAFRVSRKGGAAFDQRNLVNLCRRGRGRETRGRAPRQIPRTSTAPRRKSDVPTEGKATAVQASRSSALSSTIATRPACPCFSITAWSSADSTTRSISFTT
jgi:hypothetical protein